ncbi:21434_t:CDS:2, partial [Gigaspora rosea]
NSSDIFENPPMWDLPNSANAGRDKTIEALFKFWTRKRSLEEVNASLYESVSVCENGSMCLGRYKSTNGSDISWGSFNSFDLILSAWKLVD